jgi:hypothetical protein
MAILRALYVVAFFLILIAAGGYTVYRYAKAKYEAKE